MQWSTGGPATKQRRHRLPRVENTLEPVAFVSLHAAWFVLSIASGAFLLARPRPRVALLVLILLHGGAFLGYYGGLARPYAVGVSSDRPLGLGMAVGVANGRSPFDHVQVEFSNLEPFWTFLVAALSGFSAAWVPFVYDRMALLAITLTALGFYWAWALPNPGEPSDVARWRGVFVAASVLGLSSLGLTDLPPTQHFWQGNFVFKPNHALAFGLVGLLSRAPASGRHWLHDGILQGLLIWVFILDWAYLLPGLLLSVVLHKNRIPSFRHTALATATGLTLGAPYILHMLRDYSPFAKGEMPQIWRDQMGDRLMSPYWWSLDLGPLLLLSIVGIVLALRSRDPSKEGAGFLLSGPLVAVAYAVGVQFGFAPEPDEGLHYSRMAAAAAAGYALWVVASRGEGRATKFYALGFTIILACSFPAYFDPGRHDRYYMRSREPLPVAVQSAAEWISTQTPTDARFVCTGVRTGIMLSALTGRQFLMLRPDQTADRAEREAAEREILTSLDETAVRRAASRYGVTHVLLDEELNGRFGDAARGLGNRPWFEPQFANFFLRILKLKPPANGG